MENDIATRNARANDYLMSVKFRHLVRRDRMYEISYPVLVTAAWAGIMVIIFLLGRG